MTSSSTKMFAASCLNFPTRNCEAMKWGSGLAQEPANDDRFIGVFAHELEHSGGYTPEEAKAVARKLLPDILFYHPNEAARFPHNGRTLTDDVVDLFFSIYANRNVTDKVGPHGDLLDEFPYLGPPHNVLKQL